MSCPKKALENAVVSAFVKCGKYLQEKMPLDNDILKVCSAVDPRIKGKTSTLGYLLKIPDLTNLVDKDDVDDFDDEVRDYVTTKKLKDYVEGTAIDEWWGDVPSSKYPHLTKAVKGLLSFFHGPMVESSFSVMGELLDEKKARADVRTYAAMQIVKYHLSSRKESALTAYSSKKDPEREPICSKLTENMRKAYKDNKDRIAEDNLEKEEEARELGVDPSIPHLSKKDSKQMMYEEALKAGESSGSSAEVAPSTSSSKVAPSPSSSSLSFYKIPKKRKLDSSQSQNKKQSKIQKVSDRMQEISDIELIVLPMDSEDVQKEEKKKENQTKQH